ncbi:flippase-like domain-containing protein [bacterium]|nr:flippase-like domain-containing protein [bacterium]
MLRNATSAPVVIAERLTDLIALVIISFAGIGLLATGDYMILVVAAAILGSFVLAIGNRRFSLFVIGLVEKIPVVEKIGHRLHTAYDSMSALMRPGPLMIATTWSILAWLCECLGFYTVIHLFDGGANPLVAAFMYAFGTIAGVISPGGLGITDGTMIAMMQNAKMMGGAPLSKGVAGAATMLVRMGTLWFAVVVGAVVLMRFQSRFAGADLLLDKEEELEVDDILDGEHEPPAAGPADA